MRTRFPLKLLAVAGMICPVGFTALVIVQGMMHPDYHHISMSVSALAAWPDGWLQNLNFFVSGTLLAAFAIGVHATIRPTRFGLLGIVLSLASAAGVFMCGLFPWIKVDGVLMEPPQHAVAAILTFSSASTGLLVLSRRMSADPGWQDLSTYVLATGIVMLVLFIVVGFFAVDKETPFHTWAGLLQRLLLVVWFACLLVMGRRVLRFARIDALPSPTVAR